MRYCGRVERLDMAKAYHPTHGLLWHAVDKNEEALTRQHNRELRVLIDKALRFLPDRHREVLCLRYFEHKSLGEVGEIMGVCRERVRQLEAKAIWYFQNNRAWCARALRAMLWEQDDG
jgi:RNA polymerase sigma factor (sigma-70 family)